MNILERPYEFFGISKIPAPVVDITIKDLLGNNPTKVKALVDTGYDGYLIVPPAIYEHAGLTQFEIDLDAIPPLETFGGERISIRSANGLVLFEGFSEELLCEVDTHEICGESLIGRQLLALFRCTLDEPVEVLSLTPEEIGNT